MTPGRSLRALPGIFAVSRLAADAPIPTWPRGAFVSISRTPDELSIVSSDDAIPDDINSEHGWRCLAVAGPIPFEVTGVAARLTAPLAAAGIPLFLVSTFDTDYLLVKQEVFERAVVVLREAGWEVG